MMMSGMTVVAWLWVGLIIRLTAGHSALTTTTPGMAADRDASTGPCAGEHILEALQALLSVAGDGSNVEPSTMKNKFLALEAKLEAAEAKQEATQTKLEAMETKMITKQEATETKLEAMKTKQEATETKLEATETKLEATETKLEAMETKLEATETKLEATDAALQSTRARSKGESTFIRWGRTTCSNSSQLVYSGVAGGSFYQHTGAAANLLCLTLSPQTDSTPLPQYYTFLYGSEYENIPNHHNHDVPCSVCLAAQSATIMIPATHDCPTGWTPQYTGRLAAGHRAHKAATEYVCLDGDLENVLGGHVNHNGNLLYYVITQCGSLPCPPYSNGTIVLCVVCSK